MGSSPTGFWPKPLAFLLPLAVLALPPEGKSDAAAAPPEIRPAGLPILLSLAVFVAISVPIEALAWERLFPVVARWPVALTVAQASYFLVLLLLAGFAARYGRPLIAAVSLVAVGVGFTLFIILPAAATVHLAALLLLTVGLAATDSFYCLSLWHLAPHFGAGLSAAATCATMPVPPFWLMWSRRLTGY